MGGKLRALLAGTVMTASMAAIPVSHADSAPYIGDVMPVAFNFCPRGWTAADGKLLPISSNQALFSLYGATFGGDARTTFAVPDLRGRMAAGMGPGPGLTNRQLGSKFGSETVTLMTQNLPSHTHSIRTATTDSTTVTDTPNNNMIAAHDDSSLDRYRDELGAPGPMAQGTLANTGGSQALDIRKPTVAITWCVSLSGTFPPRN